MVELSYIAESDFSLPCAATTTLNTLTSFSPGHPTDRFGKLSVRKALNPLRFCKGNFHLEFSWYGTFKAYCYRIDKNVVSGTEKRSAKVFGKWPDKNAQVILQRLKFP